MKEIKNELQRLYVMFLILTQTQFSCLELSKCSGKSHDTWSRWLSDAHLTPKMLWDYAKDFVDLKTGYLVVDDTLLDKIYSKQMELVKLQYSGKHHGIVRGICVVNLLWTNGEKIIPVDYRIYDPESDGKTKNDHMLEMLNIAELRGFKPEYVLMDSWYTSIDNIKTINKKGWKWIGGIKSNRKVSLVKNIYMSVSDLDWTSKQVHKVWLKEYGFVVVSRIVFSNGDATHVATNDLSLPDTETIKNHNDHRWTIETFHRGIKQCCGIEKCYSTKQRSQRNHIFCSFLSFLSIEAKRLNEGISWYEQKIVIGREGVKMHLLA